MEDAKAFHLEATFCGCIRFADTWAWAARPVGSPSDVDLCFTGHLRGDMLCFLACMASAWMNVVRIKTGWGHRQIGLWARLDV